MILHICPNDVWQRAKEAGVYEGDTLATEGFIHCSTPEQVIEVANYLFKGREDLVLLVIDENEVHSEIKYEDAGNRKLYPHIYGKLNTSAIKNVVTFTRQKDGTFTLPELGVGNSALKK